MAAKWEKIQAKEAKKAEKSRMPEKKVAVSHFLLEVRPLQLDVHLYWFTSGVMACIRQFAVVNVL